MRMTMSLKLMSMLCTVGIVVCLGSMGAARAQEEGDNWMELQINNEQWQFVGGAWAEDEQGIITAPGNLGENLAVYTDQAYADFEAEFEFRWDGAWTNAGLVFRARDAQHYYVVHFPVSGQQRRAEHFWAAISKVDESGFVEMCKMEMMHGVTSQVWVWHRVRVTAEGNEIRVWVDGRPMSVVQDDTYGEPGYMGLSTSACAGAGAKSSFRNLRIRGEEAQAQPWDASVQPVSNSFVVSTAGGSGCGNIVRAPNGDLLVTTSGLLRSTDNGRTWSSPEALPEGLGGGRLHTTGEGLLVTHVLKSSPPFQIMRATSTDSGKTWSEPVQTGEVTFPPEKPYSELYATRLLELQDGTLLMFAYARTTAERSIIDGIMYYTLPVPEYVTICLRSTDAGQSWSAPVDLDGPPHAESQWMAAKDLRNEIAAAQTRDGSIITLARPHYSPLMWESWSEDGGQTWTPTTRGPFPMYGGASMVCTTSGALIIGGRFPGIAVQVSHDDGMTWDCYMIDSAIWANGDIYEVAPDLVLFLYGGPDNPRELRGMFLRVTPDGLEPAREMLPSQ